MLRILAKERKNGHDENQYLRLVEDIFKEGEWVDGRNGRTKVVFGSAMHYSLSNGTLPLLTTKKLAWKSCLHELLWFIGGKTDNSLLKKAGVHIWDANGNREFLDSRGLHHLNEDDLGPVYGHQWRHFNAKYSTCQEDYSSKGVDQLQYIIDCLRDPSTRNSRRLVMSAWNPVQLNEMALPPCHILAQFNVVDGNKLSCSLYQRSGDVGLGVPFNIASYSFLTHLLAKHCDLEAHEFIHYIGNTHIYENHVEPLEQQIARTPMEFPKVSIERKCERIDDYKFEDFKIIDYKHHPVIKMQMSA